MDLNHQQSKAAVLNLFKAIPQYCIAHPFCTRFSRHIARTHERVRVQNVRDFPQNKLDNEISARFLLNGHRKVPFLLH